MKKIAILGSTGSIGTQTLEVVRANKDIEVTALAAGSNIDLLEKQIREFSPKIAAVWNEEKAKELKDRVRDLDIRVESGMDGLLAVATELSAEIVVTAVVGMIGIRPTIAAMNAGKDIALANKETLVVAGHIIIPLAKKYGIQLLPVDSEHSAIFQSMHGEYPREISKILLTCSGGSFRDKSLDELKDATVEQALNHPNWSMGAKITIDSATLVNKGLEVMEAKWLFDVDYDDVEVLIHPESVVHSMIECTDTAVIGQLGTPDMRLPIQYALTYPHRIPLINSKRLSLSDIGTLHFYKPDTERFKALPLAYRAGRIGGSMPCVFNGANEEANQLFRDGKIKFLEIVDLIEEAMNAHTVVDNPSLDELIKIDAEARAFVRKRVGL